MARGFHPHLPGAGFGSTRGAGALGHHAQVLDNDRPLFRGDLEQFGDRAIAGRGSYDRQTPSRHFVRGACCACPGALVRERR